MSKIFMLTLILMITPWTQAEEPAFYFGNAVEFDPRVPAPQSYLGFGIGDRHVRHDQLVGYMELLAKTSDRVHLDPIGSTYEQRPMVQLVISSPENLAHLDTIRQAHLDSIQGRGELSQQPVVIWMGYSIHGNEPSGANASLMVAYYLAAAQQLEQQLKEVVVILEPCLNPDGMTRFATWVNSNRGKNLVADAQTREHQEPWPQGRGNHYWFDLNRDWLLQVNPESRARVARFHQWRPNILTDHHEMGSESSFFFQPGVPTRQNPLTPSLNLELTHLLAKYHAKALDEQGKLYFSEQAFDDFYYGKGSTYPDIHGCIGILFEQASSRGHLQENTYGPLPFADTIKNQVTTSLSTFKAGYENRLRLLQWQRDDAAQALADAAKDPIKAFLFNDEADPMRVNAMVQLLRYHHIKVYTLARPWQGDGRVEHGFVVPMQQAQYRLVKSLFETRRTFSDTTFYDVSTWHLPSAFGVAWRPLDKLPEALLGPEVEAPAAPKATVVPADRYAYAFSWQGEYAPRAANRLLREGVVLRYATQAFVAKSDSGPAPFTQGAVIVPMGIQTLGKDQVVALLQQVSGEDGLTVVPIQSGLTPEGIDLGSASFEPMTRPRVALVSGEGTDPGDVGSLWHELDVIQDMTVSLLDVTHMSDYNLSGYTHLVMANARYDLNDQEKTAIGQWLKQGGTLVAIGGAINWAIDNKLVEASLRPPAKHEDGPKRLPFEERATRSAAEIVSGAAFWADLDLTHPLGYGFPRKRVALFRTDNRILELINDPYGNVAVYSEAPLISGYVSAENLGRIEGSAAVAVTAVGKGAVVLINDPPCFRGFWIGSSKLFLNSLFFNVKP